MADDRYGRYRRHDLVCVAPAAWSAMLAARPDLDGVPCLAEWADVGRPLIVRRYVAGESREQIPLGLPLPPSAGKRRIGLLFPAEHLTAHCGPTLRDARGSAPAAWQATVAALLALGDRKGIMPRPFGSLLWQAVTGLTYLTSASDLDVFWPLTSSAAPLGLVEGLARIASAAPMGLDGEFLLPDGGGIHWREWMEAPEGGEVLVKYLDRVELRPVASLRERAD